MKPPPRSLRIGGGGGAVTTIRGVAGMGWPGDANEAVCADTAVPASNKMKNETIERSIAGT